MLTVVMKLSHTMSESSISLLLLLALLTIIDATLINPIIDAGKSCDFPAIFNFGDSNSDTGGYAACFGPRTSPFGDTYFHSPAGRFSDGRLIIDFIVESFGLPFLDAYLDSIGSNFSHGINFASAASTICLPNRIIPKHGGFSPFYLDLQYSQFKQVKSRLEMVGEKGGLFESLMPKKEYFPRALYTFDIGHNDLIQCFIGNLTMEEAHAYIPDIINKFSANIKNIYSLGGRSFWIHNTGPLGCLPYVLSASSSAEKDSAGCSKPHNEVVKYFNLELKEAVAQLRVELPSAAFTYVDIYSVKYSLFAEPLKHGFELPLLTCCGYGGQYNFNFEASCGATITVNGTNIFVGSCENPSVRVVWDGIHFTDAANKFVFDQISTGTFSDPPLPLKQACQRHSIDSS